MQNKVGCKTFFKAVGEDIKLSFLTKRSGFYIALVAVALSIAQAFIYGGVAEQDFNPLAVVFSVLAFVTFALLSLFTHTSPLAPIALMIFDALSLLAFGSVIVDYFSTAFFDGISVKAFFALDFPYWFSTLSFALTTVISSVSIYFPQNKKTKLPCAEEAEACQEEEKARGEEAEDEKN